MTISTGIVLLVSPKRGLIERSSEPSRFAANPSHTLQTSMEIPGAGLECTQEMAQVLELEGE